MEKMGLITATYRPENRGRKTAERPRWLPSQRADPQEIDSYLHQTKLKLLIILILFRFKNRS
jgi:hypothetical protein